MHPASRYRLLAALTLLLAASLGACDGPLAAAEPATTPYLESATERRALLEAALWQPELPYSRELLDSYGFSDLGWELLPEQTSASRPLTVTDAKRLEAGLGLTLGELTEHAPVELPTSRAGWRALGETVFTQLPLREDGYLTWLASRPSRWPDLGVTPNADGTVRGLVVFQARNSRPAVGVTCVFCHGGDGIVGRGDRELDVGAIRAEHAAEGGRDMSELLSWGPGRADVTDDGVPSVTAIPDMWGLGHAQYLNHSGAIAVSAPGTLAVRFETQYIKGHRMRSRPARQLMWAMERFLTGLQPPRESLTPTPSPTPTSDAIRAGRQQFNATCAGCHAPDAGFSGGLVAADTLAVDPAVATTPERGTGSYKVPSLIAVSANAPYFHDGSMPSLEALLESGHPFGVLDTQARQHLLAYLHTL